MGGALSTFGTTTHNANIKCYFTIFGYNRPITIVHDELDVTDNCNSFPAIAVKYTVHCSLCWKSIYFIWLNFYLVIMKSEMWHMNLNKEMTIQMKLQLYGLIDPFDELLLVSNDVCACEVDD